MRAGKKKQQQERKPMDWDVFSDDEQPVAAAATGEKIDMPEGVHELKIVTTADSEAEAYLELAHDDRRFWWVKVRAKKRQGWAKALIRSLAESLGMNAAEWAATPLDDLTGRRVMAELYHKVDKNGRQWVNVGKFLPIEQLVEEAAAVAKRPARTPAAKVKAASPAIGSDDIPF
jgi:hypothetical protein